MSRKLGIRPRIGMRVKLSTRGAGQVGSLGRRPLEVRPVLERDGGGDEFHARRRTCSTASSCCTSTSARQITAIRSVKNALREAGRFYVELVTPGAPLQYLDVGGGLGVDYDGSQTNFASSMNYTLQEYANDVVFGVQETCDAAGVPHPTIVTESGRAVVAHHAVLVIDVLGSSEFDAGKACRRLLPEDATPVVQNLFEYLHAKLDRKNVLEAYHDASEYKEECLTLFSLGHLSLDAARGRPRTSSGPSARRSCGWRASWTRCPRSSRASSARLADTYFCNFSRVPVAARLLGDRPALPDHAHPPAERRPRRGAACSPTSPATPTARSTTSSTGAT